MCGGNSGIHQPARADHPAPAARSSPLKLADHPTKLLSLRRLAVVDPLDSIAERFFNVANIGHEAHQSVDFHRGGAALAEEVAISFARDAESIVRVGQPGRRRAGAG